LNQKLNLDGQFTILVATTGWVDYQALERLLITVRRTFPSSNILFRPHPSYDNVSRIASKEINYILVEKENKYDLFSVADAVLSPPSSMITEASRFTDNIIVYPNRNDTGSKGREILQRQYPNLKVMPLEDISRLLTQLEYFRNHPQKKHPQTDAFDYEKELDRLFYRIENDDIVGVRN
jgi:CDP-glycerol glycerophosphotransferase (TagB/SpsB family)